MPGQRTKVAIEPIASPRIMSRVTRRLGVYIMISPPLVVAPMTSLDEGETGAQAWKRWILQDSPPSADAVDERRRRIGPVIARGARDQVQESRCCRDLREHAGREWFRLCVAADPRRGDVDGFAPTAGPGSAVSGRGDLPLTVASDRLGIARDGETGRRAGDAPGILNRAVQSASRTTSVLVRSHRTKSGRRDDPTGSPAPNDSVISSTAVTRPVPGFFDVIVKRHVPDHASERTTSARPETSSADAEA